MPAVGASPGLMKLYQLFLVDVRLGTVFRDFIFIQPFMPNATVVVENSFFIPGNNAIVTMVQDFAGRAKKDKHRNNSTSAAR